MKYFNISLLKKITEGSSSVGVNFKKKLKYLVWAKSQINQFVGYLLIISS
jgi:hypothetical protein